MVVGQVYRVFNLDSHGGEITKHSRLGWSCEWCPFHLNYIQGTVPLILLGHSAPSQTHVSNIF